MKKLIGTGLAIVLIGSAIAPRAFAQDNAAGYFDFGKFTESEKSGEFVEVDIKGNIIAMAAQLAAKSEKEVADALNGLKAVRVNVLKMNDKNRAEVQEHVQQIRTTLNDGKWDRMVTVQQKDADVGVYLKTRKEKAIEGIVVTVINKNKEAVLINIIGDIQPEKLALVAERFNIDPLKEIAPRVAKK